MKVTIQSDPKYFGESMHLIVTDWLQNLICEGKCKNKAILKKSTLI